MGFGSSLSNRVALGIGSFIFFLIIFLGLMILSFSRPFTVNSEVLDSVTGYIAEGILLCFFVGLGVWYKKSSKERRSNFAKPVVLGVLVGVCVVYATILWFFHEDASSFTHQVIVRQANMKLESPTYVPLMTTIFDKAETMNVRKDIDEKYSVLLGLGAQYTGREPSYFIRLKDGKIQKLFQSGNLKTEVVDTSGERMVVEMLLRKRPVAEYPQYTCCGGDDVFPDVPFFRHLLPQRRYLKDFASEMEVVSLIYDDKGAVLGAKVRLYGD